MNRMELLVAAKIAIRELGDALAIITDLRASTPDHLHDRLAELENNVGDAKAIARSFELYLEEQ